MRGVQDVNERAEKLAVEIAKYVKAEVATIYLTNEGEEKFLTYAGGYAFSGDKNKTYQLGESLLGQAALEGERIVFTDIPDHYISINSSLGGVLPKNIVIQPFFFQGELKGVFELAFSKEIPSNLFKLLDKIVLTVAIGINAA